MPIFIFIFFFQIAICTEGVAAYHGADLETNCESVVELSFICMNERKALKLSGDENALKRKCKTAALHLKCQLHM